LSDVPVVGVCSIVAEALMDNGDLPDGAKIMATILHFRQAKNRQYWRFFEK